MSPLPWRMAHLLEYDFHPPEDLTKAHPFLYNSIYKG